MKQLFPFLFLFFFSFNGFAQFEEKELFISPFSKLLVSYPLDIDEDGDMDIIGSTAVKTVWLENVGGAFERPKKIFQKDYSLLKFPPIDLNGDGRLDVIVREAQNYFEDGLTWLSNEGNNQFEAHQIILPGYSSNVRTLKIIDLNQDGHLDVIVGVDKVTPMISEDRILYWQNKGEWQFDSATVVTTSAIGPASLDVADVNGDGYLDILSASSQDNEVSWYPNDGNMNFPNQVIISKQLVGAMKVLATDVDADGDVDVISASNVENKMVWHRNDGNGVFDSFSFSTNQNELKDVQLTDLNHDGRLDLLAFFYWKGVAWYKNNGAGFTYFKIQTDEIDTQWAIATDINADGWTDVAYGFADLGKTMNWKPNDGKGNFGEEDIVFQPIYNVNDMLAKDLDEDGDLDILVYSNIGQYVAWFENDGFGNFSDAQFITTQTGGIAKAHIHDLDNNGKVDVLTLLTTLNQIVWYPNNGWGDFEEAQVIADDLQKLSDVFIEDFDQDGDVDLLAIADNGTNLYWIEQQGIGQFEAPITLPLQGWSIIKLHTLDVDGDSDVDVVVALSHPLENNKLIWWENNGNGGLTAEHLISTIDNEFTFLVIHSIDKDNNGTLDILVTPWNKDVAIFKNDGLGNFEAPCFGFQPLPNYSFVKLESKDVDFDGDLDVIGLGYQDIFYYNNDGTGNFEATWKKNTYSQARAFGDINGDLRSDILVYSYGRFYWYENLVRGHIRGTSFFDQNQNGVYDEGEPPLIGMQFLLSPEEEILFPDENGNFAVFSRPGIYQLHPQDHPLWETTVPALMYPIVVLPNMEEELPIYYFGFKPRRILPRVQPFVSHDNPRCNSVMNVWLELNNTGTTFADGKATLEVSELLSLVEANPPADYEENGILHWNFQDIAPSHQQQIHLQYQVPNANFIGEEVFFQVRTEVLNEQNEVLYGGNEFKKAEIRCSFDPNDKLVHANNLNLQTNSIWVKDTVYYTIRFQNTGNAEALNVSITDSLDTNLDIAHFHVIASSHDMRTMLSENGVVKFLFQDIFLPDSTTNEPASHGFVTYGATFKEELHEGIEVTNTAYIFFDFNSPIVTNTTANPITYSPLTHVASLQKKVLVKVYPNPFSDFTTIEATGLLQGNYRLELVDITGKQFFNSIDFEKGKAILKRNNLTTGMYLYQIRETNSGQIIANGKLILEN